jgi:Cytochrome c554 and c-prime
MTHHGILYRRAVRLSAALLCAAVSSMIGFAAHTQTPGGDYKHLGVASCATTVCHGKPMDTVKSAKDKCDANVQNPRLHEYGFWISPYCDLHSKAYAALTLDKAKQITAKLGLRSATSAKICLDCHADNVPKLQQEGKFHLDDGVGCEACHGGAEKWIASHKDAKHTANVALGLYPNEQPLKRAELCLSCHLGTVDKFATHELLGAGHPRLSFELEAFTTLEPPHFRVDSDYVARKGKIEGINLWFTGQLATAERYLTLLQSPLLTPSGMIPELAFYDCYACHHSKDKMRWSQARAGAGIKPGTLRLQKQSLLMLQAFTEALGSAQALAQLRSGTEELLRAGKTDPAAVRTAAQKLLNQMRTLEPWTGHEYTAPQVAKVRKALLRLAAEDRASDFTVAEQVVMAIDSLSHSLNDQDKHKAPLDALFVSVKNGSDFNPAQFAEVAMRAQDQF